MELARSFFGKSPRKYRRSNKLYIFITSFVECAFLDIILTFWLFIKRFKSCRIFMLVE